jgi:quinol monooxygenase YgiN
MQTTRVLFVAAALALAASGASAQQPKPAVPGGPVYVATFIDLMPPNTPAGTKAIQQYVAETKRDTGNVRTEAIAQEGRENHLVIYEVWQSKKAFDAHEALPHTKAFKTTLYPLMGAPFDQREHHLVAGGTTR